MTLSLDHNLGRLCVNLDTQYRILDNDTIQTESYRNRRIVPIMESENPSTRRFREYLRIKTVHPDPNYDGALNYLAALANEIGLPWKTVVTNLNPRREVGIITWEGTKPYLPSIMLNSHMDVVTVSADAWKYDPFLAHKDEKGFIFARGTQDMKSVGMQYLEAVRKLKLEEKTFPRTIHMTFVPDEENDGPWGMRYFVTQKEFKDMNVGFALDEGIASPTQVFNVYYGERHPFSVEICCRGNPGHGSKFITDSAPVKFSKVLHEINSFRTAEMKKLENNAEVTEGDVTTVNVTMVEGGDMFNVVPPALSLTCDVRVPPGITQKDVETMAAKWCKAGGNRVEFFVINRGAASKPGEDELHASGLTSIDESNPWWKVFCSACKNSHIKIKPGIFPASTDSTFLRHMGIPALGFSPMNNTPILLHSNDECLHEDVFLKGIDIYKNIISSLAMLD